MHCDLFKKFSSTPTYLYFLDTSMFCLLNLALKYIWNRFLCVVWGRGQVLFSHLQIIPTFYWKGKFLALEWHQLSICIWIYLGCVLFYQLFVLPSPISHCLNYSSITIHTNIWWRKFSDTVLFQVYVSYSCITAFPNEFYNQLSSLYTYICTHKHLKFWVGFSWNCTPTWRKLLSL